MLSGALGAGKTTLCATVAALARAQNLVVAGVLTPTRQTNDGRIGRDVEDLRSGERRPLAEPAGTATGLTMGDWQFHADGLAWGTTILRHATPCDLLIIDELGPLELIRGEGWAIGVDLLRAGDYRLALVVIRPALLPDLQARIVGQKSLTLVVTGANREHLPGQIMALLRGQR